MNNEDINCTTFENNNNSTTATTTTTAINMTTMGQEIAAIYDEHRKLKTMNTLSVPDAEIGQRDGDTGNSREQRRKGLASHSFRMNWQIMSSSFNSDAPGR